MGMRRVLYLGMETGGETDAGLLQVFTLVWLWRTARSCTFCGQCLLHMLAFTVALAASRRVSPRRSSRAEQSSGVLAPTGSRPSRSLLKAETLQQWRSQGLQSCGASPCGSRCAAVTVGATR